MLPEEQETIIRFDEKEDDAVIYTASKSVADKLIKAGLEPNELDNSSWEFILPKHTIKVKPDKTAINLNPKRIK